MLNFLQRIVSGNYTIDNQIEDEDLSISEMVNSLSKKLDNKKYFPGEVFTSDFVTLIKMKLELIKDIVPIIDRIDKIYSETNLDMNPMPYIEEVNKLYLEFKNKISHHNANYRHIFTEEYCKSIMYVVFRDKLRFNDNLLRKRLDTLVDIVEDYKERNKSNHAILEDEIDEFISIINLITYYIPKA